MPQSTASPSLNKPEFCIAHLRTTTSSDDRKKDKSAKISTTTGFHRISCKAARRASRAPESGQANAGKPPWDLQSPAAGQQQALLRPCSKHLVVLGACWSVRSVPSHKMLVARSILPPARLASSPSVRQAQVRR